MLKKYLSFPGLGITSCVSSSSSAAKAFRVNGVGARTRRVEQDGGLMEDTEGRSASYNYKQYKSNA
jgi:hypothetical protein